MKRELLITSLTVLLMLAPMGLSAQGEATNETNETDATGEPHADDGGTARDDGVAANIEAPEAEVPNATDASNEGVTDDLNTWVDETGDRMTGDLHMGSQSVTLGGRALRAGFGGALLYDGKEVCLDTGNCVAGSGDITAVMAGFGLAGGGTSGDVTVQADENILQRRVSNACADGSSIRAIAVDGSLTCEADDVGITSETDPTVNTVGKLDLSPCEPNQIIKKTDGAWRCDEDADTWNVYTAGDGIELDGNEFNLPSCPNLYVLRFFSLSDGPDNWGCSQDFDTTYTAGDGLTLTGTTLSLDDCAIGSVMKVFPGDGGGPDWTCGTDQTGSSDAETLDGLDSTAFLRSDVSDTFAGDQLTLEGDLEVQGQITMNAVTRTLAISPAAWTPRKTGLDYERLQTYFRGTTSGQLMHAHAPVNLPDGATITKVTAHVTDASADEDVTLDLLWHTIGTSGQSSDIAELSTTGTPGGTSLSQAVSWPVDNTAQSLTMAAFWFTPTSHTDIQVHDVVIEYTVDQPLP